MWFRCETPSNEAIERRGITVATCIQCRKTRKATFQVTSPTLMFLGTQNMRPFLFDLSHGQKIRHR